MPARILYLWASLSLPLSACNHLGLCHSENLDAFASPGGVYSAEIITRDCLGQAPVQKVTLRKTEGRMATTVAVFDDSVPDTPTEIRVRWEDDRTLDVSATGGHMWMFQSKWRDVKLHYQ
ncbi:MAG: hypothetical protein WBQ60_07830 [Asticcacaulis sp.]